MSDNINLSACKEFFDSKKLLFKEFSQDFRKESLSEKEIDEFSIKITGLWKKIDFFNWIINNSHGIHESTGLPDYNIWWDDIEAIKKGNVVLFNHLPGCGGHNTMIPTAQLLNQAMTGYLLTGDEVMGEVTEKLCKGLTATMKGMQWNENDKTHYLMARNIISNNHAYEVNGRKKEIDYSNWRKCEEHWNAKRIQFPNNPYWGDIYVTNTRSKDDLPQILRAAGFLPSLIIKAKNINVSSAAIETYNHLKGFCRDIVDNGFYIRTKDSNGNVYTPKGNLANFIDFGLKAEANARLTISLFGYDTDNNIKCDNGYNKLFELIATRIHYYNYKIIHGFHMTAILHSLNNGNINTATELLYGLKKRADDLMNGKGHGKGMKNINWKPDLAVFLLKAASVGLPLNSQEVKVIHNEYSKAIDFYEKFPRWDLWDDSVPDGVYGPNGGYKPYCEGIIPPEEITRFLEYCYSPYQNPLGEKIVNTEIISNPLMW